MNSSVVEIGTGSVVAAGRWCVVRTIAAKECLDIYRDSRVRWLAVLALLLMVCGLLFGIDQVQSSARDQAAAAQGDRQLWVGQGNKDPHAAAHFGQYAFKPQSPLALADPGVDAYLGTAVWLEAHKQNEVQFRPARDSGIAARLGNVSLAVILQTVVPLLVILLGFATFTGERERGTLRQLLSLGVAPLDLLLGKGLAMAGVLLVFMLPTLVGIVVGTLLSVDGAGADQWARLLWLALAYMLYLGGFVLLALAVSAFFSTSRAALVVLLGFWLCNSFLVPRLMTDWVRISQPLPTALAFQEAVAADKKKDFGHDEGHPAFAAFRDGVLRQYGVTRVEDLPVNFRGLALRKSDEIGYAIYDRHFGALQTRYEHQDQWRAVPGMVFPFLAIQPFSMGMAGTDSRSHAHFSHAAEQYRRHLQTVISSDLTENSRYGDVGYVAGPELWGRMSGFIYSLPQSGWALSAQIGNLISLVIWSGGVALLALLAVRRLRPV